MRRRPVLALLVGLALTAGACSSGDDDTSLDGGASTTSTAPAPDAGVGPNGFVPDPIEWDDCGAQDCATVTVPIDYADLEGERLTLAVVRQPASGDRLGAVFVNPGGPGASAVEFATLLPPALPGSITEHFDIVGVDPRGVGESSPIDCGFDAVDLYGVDPTLDSDADRAALLDISQAYVQGCEDDAAELLPHLGTRDVARDMDAVRAAMGDGQLSYIGASYGTAIGQVYAELFPTRVRSMVLDAVLELGPSGTDLAVDQAGGFELALDRYAEHCRVVSNCDTSEDPEGAIDDAVALSESTPGGIPAPDADRPAGPGELNVGIAYALYSDTLWDTLDRAVAEALDGDGSLIVQLADAYLEIGSFDVYFAVNCLDFAWPTDPEEILAAGKAAAAAAPHFGEALVTDYVRCAYWPAPADPLTTVTAPGTPPILVISTTGDPATPYEAGVAVAERLESGVLITHEGDGHGVIGTANSCVDALVAAYLLDGAVPEDGTVCS